MTASQVYECVEVLPSAKWVLKYTTYECAEVSLLEKWVLNYATLGFPFIRGFPSHERNETLLSTMTASQVYPCEKWHPSLMMTASQVYTCAKDSLSEKFVLKNATLGSPFIRGFPSHGWHETHPLTMIAGQVYEFESFTFWKVSVKVYNFRVPVYKVVSLPWMKWNTSFNDDCWPSILVWRVSHFEKCTLM